MQFKFADINYFYCTTIILSFLWVHVISYHQTTYNSTNESHLSSGTIGEGNLSSDFQLYRANSSHRGKYTVEDSNDRRRKLSNLPIDNSQYKFIGASHVKLAYLCKVRSTSQVETLRGAEAYIPAHFHRNYEHYTNMMLVCKSNDKHNIGNGRIPYNFVIGDSKPHSFSNTCPHVYDYRGKKYQSDYLCVAAKQNHSCVFHLYNVVVTVCGGLLDVSKTHMIPYSFQHPSIGFTKPVNNEFVHLKWMHYYTDNNHEIRTPYDMEVYDVVIPVRMIWDGNFGHLYHQSVPLISHAFEFIRRETLAQAYWHCSVPTAALLLLLGVPKKRLIVIQAFQKIAQQQPVIGKVVIVPWVSGWCPSNTPSLYGVANRALKIMTNNLLLKFNGGNKDIVYKVKQGKQLIIYLPRRGQTRMVINENKIINMLQSSINKDMYDLVILNKTEEFRTIDELHKIWYEYAKYFSRARVVIGPHGSAFGNIMWAPDNVDLIEFNIFPHDPNYQNPISDTKYRSSLIAAAWAKGGNSRVFHLSPKKPNYTTLYEDKFEISIEELYQILTLLGDNIISKDFDRQKLNQFSFHWDFLPFKNKRKKSSISKVAKSIF